MLSGQCVLRLTGTAVYDCSTGPFASPAAAFAVWRCPRCAANARAAALHHSLALRQWLVYLLGHMIQAAVRLRGNGEGRLRLRATYWPRV